MISKRSNTEWLTVLLLPVLVLAALLAQFLPGKKTRDRTTAEVVEYLRNLVSGLGGEWDWDDFESIPITDPELDRIRKEAVKAGPPNPDLATLAVLLQSAESLLLKQP